MSFVRTRFAPSPTGYLHIGGARTALFNWLFARQNGGEFVLRFEDTDAARSRQSYADGIMADMRWLGLQWDGEAKKQSQNADKHRQAAKQLLDCGAAYHCYCTPEELATMREMQLARGESPTYNGKWRDSKNPPPTGIKPVLRLKTATDGESVFADAVKGTMRAQCAELDDFVILRANGEPTYNLANVVDDMEGGITHIIRGDDHLMNTHRQLQLFSAFGKTPPVFAHLPMILSRAQNAEGAPLSDDKGEAIYERMSKRAAAAGIAELKTGDYLPAAVVNYLARLSWAHGDAEMFDGEFLLKHFSLSAINRSAARHNPDKLRWLNREHLRQTPPAKIKAMLKNRYGEDISEEVIALILPRAETLADINNQSAFFRTRPQVDNDLLNQYPPPPAFAELISALTNLPPQDWTAAAIKDTIKTTAKQAGIKFPDLAMPLRIKLTGKPQSPDIATTTALIGKQETLARLTTSA